jgi:hypothetical protein
MIVIVCALAAACADANQTVSGGELRFDAAVPATTPDGGLNLCFKGDAGRAAATTWTSLYNDYFGGSASCSLNSGCHGSNGSNDGGTSGGYEVSHYFCPKGDKDGCYAGITDPGAQFSRGTLNIALVNVPKPNESGLFKVLRKVNGDTSGGGNRMPQSPTCYFSDADMSRILKWMGDGAKND